MTLTYEERQANARRNDARRNAGRANSSSSTSTTTAANSGSKPAISLDQFNTLVNARIAVRMSALTATNRNLSAAQEAGYREQFKQEEENAFKSVFDVPGLIDQPTVSLTGLRATLDKVEAKVARQDAEYINSEVERRMSAWKASEAKLRPLPDPFGLKASRDAVRERDMRAQIRRNVENEVAASYANAAIKASGGVRPMRELPDPWGLKGKK